MTSPSADSPAGVASRVIAALVDPMTRLASGADSVRYLSTIAVCAGSFATSRVTTTLFAEICVASPVARSIVRSTSVSRRPNELALVTTRPSMTQL